MNAKYIRNYLILIIASIISVAIYNIWHIEKQPGNEVSLTAFLERLDNNEIKTVVMQGDTLTGTDNLDQPFTTFSPVAADMIPQLYAKKVMVTVKPDSQSNLSFWQATFPMLLIFSGWMFFMMRQQRSGKNSEFAKSKPMLSSRTGQKETFDDVAGIEEAKEELVEIVQFLKNPGEYTRLGGRIPKGVLLQGPPGTGKTLLAKAIAGEANVPFFNISGSDFVEMFVGVGASRVRDLFRQAKKNAPCIIFIDEIDSVGRHRGAAGSGGGRDEREQTLNALLVEMDGFESGDTVVLVAATNRPDVLDPALLRPGRFDRQVTILPPDVKGRQKILEIYSKDVIMADNVDLAQIARSTPGFTGADLANLINESALLAARHGKNAVDLDDMEEAKDKILMGTARKGLVINEEERRFTAYHEAGHAMLARLLPEADPLHKITIVPRGRAMGVTQQMPLDDRHAYTMRYLTNRITILMGGRAAEELVFKQYTTGASNDLQNATQIAAKMICEWGMGDALGPLAFGGSDGGFLDSGTTQRHYSEKTASIIDEEIKRLVTDCYKYAVNIISKRINFLHKLAEVLLINETIDAEEVEIIVNCPLLNEETQWEL